MELLDYKPIVQLKGSETYRYKYCRVGYAIGVPIDFCTDLSRRQFRDYLDGKYTWDQIQRFEMTGKF